MIRIFALTDAGARLGERLKAMLLNHDPDCLVSFELKPQLTWTAASRSSGKTSTPLFCATSRRTALGSGSDSDSD